MSGLIKIIGIQDPGEPGLAGATVKLYAANGTTLLQTAPVTGNTGAYNFTGLTPGDYVVGVTPPAGYKSSAVDGGDPDNNTPMTTTEQDQAPEK
ncbi:MAG: hypothetical protein IPO69_23190 [Saprospiraceae bacterium]|nr:hypothetical protein [Saprospiraceae bacterium]